MEVEGKDGSKTPLKEGVKNVYGRGLGFDSNDRTVSRRHVSFQLHASDHKDEIRVSFEVVGKNPMWVYDSRRDEIRVYRSFERGQMEGGDMFCVSAQKPVWLTLRGIHEIKRELGLENELAESLQNNCELQGIEELEVDSVDVSNIDPVKEFGFLVMGREFEGYPKQIIRDIEKWNWFLEEPGEDSEDDEEKGKKGKRRKRKKGVGNDDDAAWMGESEDDKERITNLRKVQGPKYSTRSKDRDKPIKDTRISNSSGQKKTTCPNEKYIEDEDDETLGGFIVDDEEVTQEQESEEEEDDDDNDNED